MRVSTAVLHVALHPVTGPWSVMRELAKAQEASGLYAGIGLGLITYHDWPSAYEEELAALRFRAFRATAPKIFGTASFLQQLVRRPPVVEWGMQLAKQSRATRVVVHFHNAWMSGVFLPLKFPPQIEIRSVATFHGVNEQLTQMPLRRLVHRWMASRTRRFATHLTSVDAFNLTLAEKIFRIPCKQFKVIPNGVPDTTLRGCPVIKRGGCFTLGHVGSISERKGWRIAADAVLRLVTQGVKIRLLIAGSGPEAAEVQALAGRYPGIIEFRGLVPRAREVLMQNLDALSVMSAHEGLPMTLIEAMSLGVPVVATPAGGIPEAVDEGKNGYLVERTVESLVPRLGQLASDKALLATMSENARRYFEQRFDIGKIVQQYEALYDS